MRGPTELIIWRTRDNLWQARATATDPADPRALYTVPKQVTITTKPRKSKVALANDIIAILNKLDNEPGE